VIEHIHQCGLGMIDGKTYPYIILIRELEEKVVVTEKDFGDMAGDVEKARIETLARVKEAQAAQVERSRKEAADAAAEEARIAAVRSAEEAAARREAEHEEALAAERQRTEEAGRVAQAELERVAREEAERQAEIDRQAAERAEREANQAHRAKLKTAAKEAIITLGIPEAKAIKVVQAIVAGDVPHIRMEF
jgi:colicin import membrane protein